MISKIYAKFNIIYVDEKLKGQKGFFFFIEKCTLTTYFSKTTNVTKFISTKLVYLYTKRRRLNFTGFFLMNENVAFFSPEVSINERTHCTGEL